MRGARSIDAMSTWHKNPRENSWIRLEEDSPEYANAASKDDDTPAETVFDGETCQWCDLQLPHTAKLHAKLLR